MEAERQPGRRVRFFGCCLPIPVALVLTSGAGVVAAIRHRTARRG
jgi:hypothetical protein